MADVDIAGVSSIFDRAGLTGKNGEVVTHSTWTPQYLMNTPTMEAIQATDPATKSKKTNKIKKSSVKLVTGQPVDTPDDFIDNTSLSIDTYRKGNPGATDETLNPRTLNWDEYDEGENSNIAYMTLRVQDNKKQELISVYNRFFLQSVTESEQEKYQVVETFTGFYAFFYGKRPPVYRFSGTLLNDRNYRWNNDFKFVYENFFRGTSSVENGAELLMEYDGRLISGFALSLSMQQDSAPSPKGMPFSMDVLVVNHETLDYSLDIKSLLLKKQRELQQRKALIAQGKGDLMVAPGKAIETSDLATNGVKSPVSMDLSTSRTTVHIDQSSFIS
jgi:hypothetical protein